ncbi:S-layer homology domain-containing protein [Solibacillus sp. MA9]|uniref:S-layer homology domain-containing protein n=1 Tax=Solibacillus palustris TaxID=2908203 RepID=A0ABS9UBT1_9BACL|nr:S-layer homology domain-containing protein [Solibacillus sp. MA9]MCH7321806.1 S-layer homology domain-containing protein [Solibacillus sp. MA9]
MYKKNIILNSAKLGFCSILIAASVYGALGTEVITAEASSNEINTKVAQQVVSQFKDVDKGNYAFEAINWAKDRGIVEGYPDGTFKPNESITEAQFAKMLAEFLKIKDEKGDLIKYTPDKHWSDTYYDGLASYGVPLNGYFENSLRNTAVKRGVIAQTIGHMTGNANALSDSIYYMIGEGITTGQNPQFEGTDLFKFFGSNNNLTRGQVAAFLYRMHNANVDSATGISLLAYKNEEGLSLVGQANKGMSKLDKSLRVGKLGSETPVTGGGNNDGNTKPNPPVENSPDYNDAKLPVSETAKSVDVETVNKLVDSLSSSTYQKLKDSGREVTFTDAGSTVGFDKNTFVIKMQSGNYKGSVSYKKTDNPDLIVGIVKDLYGISIPKNEVFSSDKGTIYTSKYMIESYGSTLLISIGDFRAK